MRRKLVAGNWKMNLNLVSARALVTALRERLNNPSSAVDVVICPPTLYLFPMAKSLDGSGIQLGAQNVFEEPDGAYTGEISVAMLADAGARFVILGHSERRHTIGHHEDDRMISRKLRAARAGKLIPILCIGETLSERKAGQTLEVLTFQLGAALIGSESITAAELVIAYEPVWAIGTGQNATPAQAQDAHAHIRRELRRIVGSAAADNVRILYGGSVKPDNAAEIFAQPDVDGGLIGGASLSADSFAAIVRAAVPSAEPAAAR
ncbi:MAG: triose-phosphate isomerase [Phycisphaerales bacterium]|nr:triose-phosphate isomerase [Phycisphaerales bacterium]